MKAVVVWNLISFFSIDKLHTHPWVVNPWRHDLMRSWVNNSKQLCSGWCLLVQFGSRWNGIFPFPMETLFLILYMVSKATIAKRTNWSFGILDSKCLGGGSTGYPHKLFGWVCLNSFYLKLQLVTIHVILKKRTSSSAWHDGHILSSLWIIPTHLFLNGSPLLQLPIEMSCRSSSFEPNMLFQKLLFD